MNTSEQLPSEQNLDIVRPSEFGKTCIKPHAYPQALTLQENPEYRSPKRWVNTSPNFDIP